MINEYTKMSLGDKAALDARPHPNMYDKLKRMVGTCINEAMTPYADAKCISPLLVERMLKDSHSHCFLEDVVSHYMRSLMRDMGIQPPYIFDPLGRQTLRTECVKHLRDNMDEIKQSVIGKISKDLIEIMGFSLTKKKIESYFITGEVFS